MGFHTDRRVRMRPAAATALLASAVVMLACVGGTLWIQMSDHAKPPMSPSASSAEAPAETR